MANNLYDLIKGSEQEALAEMNPELADTFLAIIERILLFCKAKNVHPRDVAITGPNFINGQITFKIKYGKLDPERGI